MPYLVRPGAALLHDVVGDGPATVLTSHGLSESGAYGSRPEISAAVADARFRLVDMDVRGHGRPVSDGSGDPDYTAPHVAADIGALATHVGAPRFHLRIDFLRSVR